MIEYRCACGKAIYWSSGDSPKPCEGCPECGTNFRKEPLQPHQFEDYYLGGSTPRKVQKCKVCDHFDRKNIREPMEPIDHIMQFFAYEHLPQHLQECSKLFSVLAQQIIDTLPRNPERTVALRKLLEAKDAAVRAKVADPNFGRGGEMLGSCESKNPPA